MYFRMLIFAVIFLASQNLAAPSLDIGDLRSDSKTKANNRRHPEEGDVYCMGNICLIQIDDDKGGQISAKAFLKVQKNIVQTFLLVPVNGNSDEMIPAASCKELKETYSTLASGEYYLQIPGVGNHVLDIKAHCKFVGNKAYTFISLKDISLLDNGHLDTLITDHSQVMAQFLHRDKSQSSAIWTQTASVSSIPLEVRAHTWPNGYLKGDHGFATGKFLITVFTPDSHISANKAHGLKSNGKEVTVNNCGPKGFSFIMVASTQNWRYNKDPAPGVFGSNTDVWAPFNKALRASLKADADHLPEDYFGDAMFHFGGCGTRSYIRECHDPVYLGLAFGFV